MSAREFMRLLGEATNARLRNQRLCTAWLREHHDIAAEHPDDGWVGRQGYQANTVNLIYPAFNRGPRPGDLIALGFPTCEREGVIGRYRLVRVTEFRPNPFAVPPVRLDRYAFEQVGEPFEINYGAHSPALGGQKET